MKEIEDAIKVGFRKMHEYSKHIPPGTEEALRATAEHAYNKGFGDCSLNCDTHVEEAEAKGYEKGAALKKKLIKELVDKKSYNKGRADAYIEITKIWLDSVPRDSQAVKVWERAFQEVIDKEGSTK